MPVTTLPFPPLEFRKWVSPVVDESYYDNPTGDYIWGPLDIGPLAAGEAYQRIFDFGCGCGREARRLLLQRHRPQSYVGLDISRPMIQWCQENLSFDGFSFHHHDVWSGSYAPDNSRNRILPIAHLGSDFTLIEANSVFTHLYADQTEFYLREMYDMLSAWGIIRLTIFFFNKQWFPMLSDDHNNLFVDEKDPTQAVFYDWNYFRNLAGSLG
ncbi:MAG TPA: class I SAM-dependent methyltransferase, partial [Candidatus Binatia bacterium]|nr:class I SAM-dependent methyltransferase [Candidatus Binatia bacterium]